MFPTKKDARDNSQHMGRKYWNLLIFSISLFQTPYTTVYFITYTLGEPSAYSMSIHTGAHAKRTLAFLFSWRGHGRSFTFCLALPTLTTTHIPCLSSAVSPSCTASYPSPPKPTPSHVEIFSSSLETLSFSGHLNLPILVKSSVLKPYLRTTEGNHWRNSHHWIFSTLLGLRHFICKMRILSRTSRNCEVQKKA